MDYISDNMENKMGVAAVIKEPSFQYQVICKPGRQKLLLEIMLKYSNLDIKSLATILDIRPTSLNNVYEGTQYLTSDVLKKLYQMVLVLMCG